MKVKNRKCIRNIAKRILFANKRRNIITIAAIIMTAVLFTSVFTIAMTVLSSYEASIFRSIGGYCHGTYKNVTAPQKEALKKNRNIKEYGERIIVGTNGDRIFGNKTLEISFMDDNCAKWSYIDLKEGRMPASENEIVMDTEVLRALGKEAVLGESVEITYDLYGIPALEGEKTVTNTFTLVGYWDFDPVSPAHYLNVSRDYTAYVSEMVENMGFGALKTDLNVMVNSSANFSEKMEKAITECGYQVGDISTDEIIRYGVNYGYTMSSIRVEDVIGSLIPILAFALLIIFTGYLIIYNIFQISVSSDIKFYGLLKTIGSTKKQIKRVVRYQALILCILGIPVGLFFGYLLGYLLSPIALSITNYGGKDLTISSSPAIFIASAVFELFTVLISVSKPGRMAGKVSPVEAVRYNEASFSGKKEKTTKGAKVAQMAFANIARNKKKTLIVFVSLSLSIVILNSVHLFIKGMDVEKWVDEYTTVDFVLGEATYFKSYSPGSSQITEEDILPVLNNTEAKVNGYGYSVNGRVLKEVSKDFYEQFRDMAIIEPTETEDGNIYMDCFLEGLDNALLDKVILYEGDLSLLKDPDAHNIAIMTHRYDNGEYVLGEGAPKIGDKITLSYVNAFEHYDSRTNKPATDDTYFHQEYLVEKYTDIDEKEYTVCAYVEVPSDISLRYSSLGFDLLMGSDAMIRDFSDHVQTLFYACDTTSEIKEAEAEAFIKDFCENNSRFSYESKAIKRAEFTSFVNMFVVLGGVLSAVIAFIGILNFSNTVIAGILSRKNELAVLQAIGMTGKQVSSMLITEGLVYSMGSGGISFILSLLFIPVVFKLASGFSYYSNCFSITPVLIALPIMVILGIAVPVLTYRKLSKESIIDRIREIFC